MKNKQLFVYAGISGITLYVISAILLIKNPLNWFFMSFLLFSFILLFIFFYFFSKNKNEVYYVFEYNYETKKIFLFLSGILLILFFSIFLYIKGLRSFTYLLWLLIFILLAYIANIKKVNIININEQFIEKRVKNLFIRILIIILLSILCQYLFSRYLLLSTLFIIFLISLLMGFYFNNINFYNEREKINKFDYIFLSIIFLIAIFFRIYKFELIPPGFTYDVRRTFDIIMQMKGGAKFGVFIGDIDISSASLVFYEIFYFMKKFGFDLINIRVFMVMHSLISLPFFYLLVKELYDKKVALFSTVIFSLSFIFVLYSRLDNGLYLCILYVILSIYFLIKGIKKGNLIFLILSGVFTGLNMYTYHAAKVNLILAILIFALYIINFKNIKICCKNFIAFFVFLISIFIVFFPLLFFIIDKFQIFTQRAQGITPSLNKDLLIYFFNNFKDIIYSFTVKGSNYEYVNLPYRPIFVGVEVILFLLGVSYLFYDFKRKNNLAILIWATVSILPEVYFSHHANPYYFRIILIFPVLAIVAGLGANVVYKYIENLSRSNSEKIYYALVLGLMFYSGYISYNDYFIKYANAPIMKEQFDYVNYEIEKFILKNAKDNKIIVSTFYPHNRSMFCMQCFKAGNKVETKNIYSMNLSDLRNYDSDVIIIAEGIFSEYFDYLKEIFPNTQINKIENKENLKFWVDPASPEYLYVIVKIPKNDILNSIGLNADFYFNNKIIKKDIVKDDIELNGVDKVILSGLIEIPETDKYKILLNEKKCRVIIDNKEYAGYILSRGLHKIKIIIDSFKAENQKLRIIVKNSKKTIDKNIFFVSGRIYGLDSVYKTDLYGNKTFNRDFMLAKRLYWFDPNINLGLGEGEFKVKWDGYFYAENDGIYYFKLFTPDEFCNIIYVNDNIIFTVGGSMDRENKGIYLKSGWNKIQIESYARIIQSVGGAYFKLLVKKPNTENYEIVKYNELKPFI